MGRLFDAAAVAVYVEAPALEVLWVRRSAGAPFLGGFHSVPGGRLEAADADGPHTGGDHVAHRVAALRETFEEVGLLVAAGAGALPGAERVALRRLLHADPAAGHRFMRERGLAWDTAGLEPVGHWVTPRLYPIRFDTRFYGLRVERPPVVEPDGREIDRAEMISPAAALWAWRRAEALVAPPLLAMLQVMGARGRFDAAAMRAARGGDGRQTLRYEIVPALQMLPLRTPTLPPATHTNAFLVGSRDAVLVEPASPYAEEIDRLVEWVGENAEEGIAPRAILCSHHHPDHVGGALQLRERLGLPLWAHALTADRLAGVIPFDRLLDDGERLELDGPDPVSLRAVHTPGHAPGHLCFLEERSGALIAGDMVASVGTILVEPRDGDMALYLDSLRRMASLDPSLLLPAHGGPIRDPQGKLDAYVVHRLWREDRVLAALAAEEGAVSPRALVPAAYDDAPAAVWPLAVGAVEAHLIKLEREGRARRVGEALWIA